MRVRVVLPGTDRVAAAAAARLRAAAAALRPGRVRLCTPQGTLVQSFDAARVPPGARVVRWRGMVFLHWQGLEYRQVPVFDMDTGKLGLRGD